MLPFGTIYVDPTKLYDTTISHPNYKNRTWANWYGNNTPAYPFTKDTTITLSEYASDKFMLFATYSKPTLQIEKDGKITEIDHVSNLYYQASNEYTQEKIGYIGEFTQGGTTTVEDNGNALITVTYPGVATLSDGSSADLVIKYTKVTIQTEIDTAKIGKYTYTDADGNSHTINGPLGIIDANQLYVDRAFIYEQGNTDDRAFKENRIGLGAQIEYEVSVEKDGNTVDGTILWTANDLDIQDYYIGAGYNTNGALAPYAESMEILEGAASYAVTPYYDHSSPKSPLGLQIDNAYYNSADSTANGVRFFAARRSDGQTYDSGFSALISSSGTKMRWTGSKHDYSLMGTILFGTTIINQIRMSHGTGGGIYLESYDGANSCKVKMIEGIAAHGLYAEATVTAVPEDGYRVKSIYVDDVAGAGTTEYRIVYNGLKPDHIEKNGTKVGDFTNNIVKVDGITFEYNTTGDEAGTVDITLSDIVDPKHVHVDFEADYFFYKTWVGDKEPTSLNLTATPYSYKYSFKFDHDGNGTESTFTMEGNTIKGAGGTWTLNGNIWEVQDPTDEYSTLQWRVAGDKVYRIVADGDDEELVTMSKKMVKAPGVDSMEFTVDEDSPLIYKKSDDEKTWYITYPSEGVKQGEVISGTVDPESSDLTDGNKADKDYDPMPIEKAATDHGNNHVDRLYWFVSEEAPGWALEEYSNANAKASGVVSDDYYEDTNWYKDSTADTSDAQKEIDKSETSAFMAVERQGGEIINAPAVIIKANKEWKDDADNAFGTRQDVIMHLDADVERDGATITKKDVLPPQKISADATGDALTVTWGDKKTYTPTDGSNILTTSANLPQGTDTEPITYDRGKSSMLDYAYRGSDGRVWYVNELPQTDDEGNKITYNIRETLADGSDVAKDDPDSGLVGYKTEYKNPANQDDNQTGTDQDNVPIYTGPVKNTLETVDLTLNKKWYSPKTAAQIAALEETMQKAVTISATPATGSDIVVNQNGKDAYGNYKSDATKKDYFDWPTATTSGTGPYTYTYKWEKLPAYLPVNGTNQKVTYSAVESQLTGFAAPQYTNTGDDASETAKALNGGTIINNQLIKVNVVKIWDDADNQDGKRGNIGVTLYQDSQQYTAPGVTNAATLTENDSNITKSKSDSALTYDDTWTWKEVFVELPYADASGRAYNYTATETTKPDGYNSDQSTGQITLNTWNTDNDTLTFTATNTHDPDKISFTVTKSWDDNNDQDGKRPQDGAVTYTLKAKPDGGTEAALTTLPAGAKILQGTKDVTNDFNNGKITVKTDSTDGATITFENLDKNAKAGKAITYSIQEANIDGYTPTIEGDQTSGFTVKNTHEPLTAKLKVDKVWDDEKNRDDKRAETFVIYIDKQKEGDSGWTEVANKTVSVDEDSFTVNEWELPAYEGGKKLTYRVREFGTITGYTTTYKPDSGTDGTTQPTTTLLDADGKAQNHTVTVTNKNEPEKISVTVTKKWDDDTNRDGKRPTVDAFAGNLTLKADDTTVTLPTAPATKTDNGDGTYTYTWTGLYKNKAKTSASDATTAITYTIEESKVDNYTPVGADSYPVTVAAGGTLENKYTPETTSVTIIKTWADNNNQDGLRPTADEYKSSLTLKAGSTDVTTDYAGKLTVTDNNNNTYTATWTGLPKNQNQTAIAYTVEEGTIEGYTANKATGLKDGDTVTNTHTPMTGTVKVTKVWDDAGAGSQAKHDALTFTLKADGAAAKDQAGAAVATKTVPANATGDALTVEWVNLPAKKDGQAITYTVEEAGADARYTTSINPAAGVQITSAGETKEITVTNTLAEPPAATPLVTKDGQFESSGNLNTQSVDANTAFTAKGTGPDGTPNKIVKIELDVPDGVEGATKNPDGSVTVPGEGTYRLDENGTVTFTPEEGFTGKSSGVKLTGTDANGETVETTYTPIVVPNKQTATLTREVEYRYVDSDGNEVTQMVTETYEFERIGSYNPAKDDDPTGYNSDPSDPDDQTTIDFPAWTPTTAKAPISPDKSADGWVVRNDADDLAGLTPDNATQLGFTADADGNLVRHDTVYYDPVPPVGTPKETFGLIGQPQKTDANKLFDVTTTTTKTGEPNKIETIQLVDPDTGKATDGPVTAYDTTGKPCGTFQIDPKTGIVTFTPNPDYEGVPEVRPVTLIATDSNGLSATATYQPHTITADDTFTNTRTINYVYDDGTPVLDDEGNPLTVTQSVTFTREPERDEEGNVLMDKEGNVVWKEWTPETGSIEDVESPDLPDNWYTDQKTVDGASGITPANAKDKMPDVTVVYHKPPTAGEKVTYGGRGETQKGTPPFTKGSKDFTGFTLIDPETGEPTDKITIEGEGTYTVDPKTGEVTFVPEPDFVGKGTGVTVRGTDENGNTADGKYTPNVVDNQQTQDKVQNITYVYEDGTPVLDDEGNPRTAQRKSTFTRTGKVDPETGTVTWDAWTPANLDEVKSPDITDYTPDKETVPATSATPETWPADEQIVYTPESKKIPWATWVDPATGRTIKAPTDFNPNGTEPGAPENPTREGYNFDGWDRSVDEEGNVTYTAKWVPQHYTIKYDANGGTGTMESQNFTGADNEAVSKTNEFTREGYTFVGFKALLPDGTYLKGENGEDLVFATAEDFMAYFYEFGDGSEITLIAQWEPVETPAPAKTYWVTYVDPATGRTIMEKTTVPVGDPEPAAPANPTREGYTFDGWDRSVDADGNITYTAKWKPVEKAAPTPTPATTRTTTTSTPTVRQVATTPAATTPRTADSNPLAAWAALAVAAAATMAFARSRSTAPQASRGKHSR